MSKMWVGLLFLIFTTCAVYSQQIAIKNNLVYDATGTVNIGGEYAVNKNLSVNLSANYNGWMLKKPHAWKHYLVQPEFRYWLRESFNEHYVGAHVMYVGFDVERMSLPFFGFTRRFLYTNGTAYGGGVSYGYHLYLTPRLNLEFSFGVGFLKLTYDKALYSSPAAHDRLTRNYIGPTQIGLSVVYIIN
jgi:long-subunit fatty acid transport protein